MRPASHAPARTCHRNSRVRTNGRVRISHLRSNTPRAPLPITTAPRPPRQGPSSHMAHQDRPRHVCQRQAIVLRKRPAAHGARWPQHRATEHSPVHVAPLVDPQRQVAVALHPLREHVVDDGLAGRPNHQGLLQVLAAACAAREQGGEGEAKRRPNPPLRPAARTPTPVRRLFRAALCAWDRLSPSSAACCFRGMNQRCLGTALPSCPRRSPAPRTAAWQKGARAARTFGHERQLWRKALQVVGLLGNERVGDELREVGVLHARLRHARGRRGARTTARFTAGTRLRGRHLGTH